MNSKKIVNKKVLFVATNTEFIKENCIPTLKWLKEKGYEIHLVSNKEKEIKYYDKYFNLPFNKSKIKTYKILKKIIEENNYEFIQCYTFWGAALTRLAAKKTKTKVIYISEKFQFYKGSKLTKWLIYYPIEKYLSKYTDTLITTNEEDYILAKNKFKTPKIKYINGLGIDEKEYSTKITEQERKEFLDEFELNKEDYIFFSTGDLTQDNNQILQIEAIMQIIPEYKNIKLLIEGEGPLEEYYNNIIQKYSLNEHIKLIGKRKDILNIMKITDALLVTNKKDNKNNNIIKAMFANKPIIASRIKEHKELLEAQYLVNVNNANELISKIEKNIIDGKRKVYYDIEKYKLSNIIESIKKIYEKYF